MRSGAWVAAGAVLAAIALGLWLHPIDDGGVAPDPNPVDVPGSQELTASEAFDQTGVAPGGVVRRGAG